MHTEMVYKFKHFSILIINNLGKIQGKRWPEHWKQENRQHFRVLAIQKLIIGWDLSGKISFADFDWFSCLNGCRNPGDDREHQEFTDCGEYAAVNHTRWGDEEAGDDEEGAERESNVEQFHEAFI